jgi:glycosyltransferase involved in cell wall biosynthesis
MSLSLSMSSPYNNILYVGPDYKNHRGGIGAVLSIYSRTIDPFNFIATNTYKNKWYEAIYFAGALIRLFAALLKNRDISLVHIHGAKDGSIVRKFGICFIAKKLFFKKIVFHSHAGAFDEYYKKGNRMYKYMCRFLVNNSEAVVVLSHRWNDFFRENFHVKKLMVIANPVEHKEPLVVKHDIDKAVTFLFLGRIADHKGIFDLVDVITKDQDELRGKCKFLVGGNHEVDKLKRAIADGKIGDLVEYIGWVQDDEKDAYFDKSDYFILPTYHEAMPMTILEALSCGKPVISTPVGSIPEVIEDGRNGYLFPPGDKIQLKKIIVDVINDRSKYDCMRIQAMNAVKRFYPESIKSELEKLYAEIL